MENEPYSEVHTILIVCVSIVSSVIVLVSVLLWNTSRKKDIRRKKKYLLDILNLNRKNGKH